MMKSLLQKFDELETKELVSHHNQFEINLKCITPRTDELDLCGKLYVIDLLLKQRGIRFERGTLI